MRSYNLLIAMSLTGFINGQVLENVDQQNSAVAGKPTSLLRTPRHLSTQTQHPPIHTEGPESPNIKMPDLQKARSLAIANAAEFIDISTDLTAGHTAFYHVEHAGVTITADMTVVQTDPVDATVTLYFNMPADHMAHPTDRFLILNYSEGEDEEVMITFVEENMLHEYTEEDLSLDEDYLEPGRLKRVRVRETPQPRVTALEEQSDVPTIDPLGSPDAGIETVYVTVTVDYGQIITSIQDTALRHISSTNPAAVSITTTTAALDSDALDSELTDVQTITTTVFVTPVEALTTQPTEISTVTTTVFVTTESVHRDSNITFSDNSNSNNSTSYIRYLFTGFFPDLMHRGNIYEITFALIASICFLYLLGLSCWLCVSGSRKSKKESRNPPPSTGPHLLRLANLGPIHDSSPESSDRDGADRPNARGTTSRRAEEGRSRAGIPKGRTGGGREIVIERPGSPAFAVEEVKYTESGQPITVVKEIKKPAKLEGMDEASGSQTGSHVADTGSLRDRKKA